MTTATEAVEILEANSLVQHVKMGPGALIPEFGYVEWEWSAVPGGGWVNYNAAVAPHTVYNIYPYLDRNLSLGEVIEAYGEPSHIKTWDYCEYEPPAARYYELALVYLPQGFYLFYGGRFGKPTIGPEVRVEQVHFFDAESDEVTAVPFNPADLVQWEGFKDFHYYSGTPEEGLCN